MFMGIGAVFWVPLSLALGRRPVSLISALLMFISTIGAGCSKTLPGFLFSLCALGLCEGFALTLVCERHYRWSITATQ